MELKDKVVVVTGASCGLGKALAEAFAKEESRLVVNSNHPEALEVVAKALGAFPVAADVSKEEEVKDLAQAAVNKFGRIDIWINNAGVTLPHMPIIEVETQKARWLMDVNFWGTFYGARAAVGEMEKQGGGVLINVISVRVQEPRAGSGCYGATKGAQDALHKVLRMEEETKGISVLGVYPGAMKTDLHMHEGRVPEGYDNFMDPADVALKIVENLKLTEPERDLVIKSLETINK